MQGGAVTDPLMVDNRMVVVFRACFRAWLGDLGTQFGL